MQSRRARGAFFTGTGTTAFAAARPMLDFLRRLPPAPQKRASLSIHCGGMPGAVLRSLDTGARDC